jgi:hypothetical protein
MISCGPVEKDLSGAVLAVDQYWSNAQHREGRQRVNPGFGRGTGSSNGQIVE